MPRKPVKPSAKSMASAQTDASRAVVTCIELPTTARHAGQALRPRLPSDLPFVPRQGSMDFAQHPSRIGSALSYRDGRRSGVEGEAL